MVAGRLKANYCFVPSCCSLSTIDENRLDPPHPIPSHPIYPGMHGLQRDATAIFYFACHRWIEIGRVIVRFSRAQTRHCNNIMAGIMTSKPACHKAIDALLSAARWARSVN